jgi:transcriptional regulator GlxA family with amidase domain
MLTRNEKPAPQAPRQVVIVAYEGAKLMDIAGPLQAFSDARFEDGCPAYKVEVASESGGLVVSDTGVKLDTVQLGRRILKPVDTLLVSGSERADALTGTAALRACLAKNLHRPRRFGSICTGAFVLAELGALDRHAATTHWAFCSRLQREYPAVKVRPDAIFVQSGRIWTSAGVSAGIDQALAMIELDLGHGAALAVARGMVLFLKRTGGQSQFSVELRRQIRDERGRFDDLHNWIRANLDQELSIPALADAAHMSPRHFARVYVRETGESPARVVEKARIEAAVRLLESTEDSIKDVANRTGFGLQERMRRAFVKTYGISPQDYRGRFGRRR